MRNDALAFVAGALSAAGLAVAILTSRPQEASAAESFSLVASDQDGKSGAPTRDGQAVAVSTQQFDQAFFATLVAELSKSPGCLGVELGQFRSGKNAIFAWFKDKAAAMAFYKSDLHQHAIEMSGFDAGPNHVAMKDIPVDSGPLLVIASAKPGKPDPKDPQAAPTLELAIELYGPLPGGVRFGGAGFSPAEFAVLAKGVKGPQTVR